MATKEELIESLQTKIEEYHKLHEQNQDASLKNTLLRVYYDLSRMKATLLTPYFTDRQIMRAEIYLKELKQNPFKEPENHLRFQGYYP